MPNLIRVLVIAAIIWLVYRLVKQWRAQSHKIKQATDDKIENMVECKLCGVHIPEKDAVSNQDGSFCSDSHMNEYKNQ